MPRDLPPRAWVELDREALAHNVAELRRLLPPHCTLMPAVKANAYGHGAVPMARELNRLGVESFCVATVQEGAELRAGGVQGEILVLGYTHPQQAPILHQNRLTQTVLDHSYGMALDAQGVPLQVHLKLDTGMHRLGEGSGSVDTLVPLFACRNLEITGAFTHLCAAGTASPEDRAFTLSQGRAFCGALAQLAARGCPVPKRHLLSSYGLLHYPELGGDYARVGIALYGVLSNTADLTRCPVTLRPVLSLKAQVAQVRALSVGEQAGYDLQFTAQRPTKLAVLTIGYGDGLPRSLSCGVGAALLGGGRAPIAGRVCMDQTLVDVTDCPPVAPGDTAVLIGTAGGLEITACDLAKQAGTIANEILSRLGARLEWRWK
ncbi:MAG: serine racemase VanT catalytic subunit [Ruminiclostridium sp.]|jgi:serine/alanine racemase|nr:serine racemase VanT catalytic subunit [Ruminiclostridium sp.]